MLASQLPSSWRKRAESMRELGLESIAKVFEKCAAELDESALYPLTLKEAVDESGYSYSALKKMLYSGRLKNVGRKGSPRILAGDLPKKPSRSKSGRLSVVDTVLRNANAA